MADVIDTSKFLETLAGGIAVGSLYALIALGYTLVYGVLQFINFAHINVFMIGAWGSYLLARLSGWGQQGAEATPWYAAPLVLASVMLICGVLGLVIERLAYRPLRNAPRLNVLITAIGVALLLENVGQLPWVFGPNPVASAALLPDPAMPSVAGVSVRFIDVLCVATAVVLMAALELLIYRTKLGLAMRAASYDHRVAALMGVPVDRVIALTFFVGSALAAAAGFLYMARYDTLQQPAHSAWVLLGLKAFVAAVVGGIGNIRGAMLGGLLIGLIEFFGAAYYRTELRDVYVFALLILVLLVRPRGLLGRAVVEKV